MMHFLRDGDTLVVESISRLARSTNDPLSIVEQLESKGVGFVSLKEQIDTSSPQGRFILTIFAASSELEKETIRQRQREGFQAAKARGKMMCRPKAVFPPEWLQVYADWQADRLTAADAMRQLGMRRTTFYKLARQTAARKPVAS